MAREGLQKLGFATPSFRRRAVWQRDRSVWSQWSSDSDAAASKAAALRKDFGFGVENETPLRKPCSGKAMLEELSGILPPGGGGGNNEQRGDKQDADNLHRQCDHRGDK